MPTPRRNIRLSDEELEAIEMLAIELKVSGQRGATLSPFIRWFCEVASAAMPETVAALSIANHCAMGGDWDDALIAYSPNWGDDE